MSKNGTDKNEGSILHSRVHRHGALAKKSVYIPSNAYGQTYYAGQPALEGATKDPVRSYFGSLWTEDKIHHGASPFVGHYESHPALTMVGGQQVALRWLHRFAEESNEGQPCGPPTKHRISFSIQSLYDYNGTIAANDLEATEPGSHISMPRFRLDRSAMSGEEWEAHFLELVENEALHPGKAQAFFRTQILGLTHGEYVLIGEIKDYSHQHILHSHTFNGEPLPDNPTSKDLEATPIGDYNHQYAMILLYEQNYGAIEPLLGDGTIEYEDYFFEAPIPFHREEMENLSNTPSALYFNVEPKYRFYEAEYEERISNIEIPVGNSSVDLRIISQSHFNGLLQSYFPV